MSQVKILVSKIEDPLLRSELLKALEREGYIEPEPKLRLSGPNQRCVDYILRTSIKVTHEDYPEYLLSYISFLTEELRSSTHIFCNSETYSNWFLPSIIHNEDHYLTTNMHDLQAGFVGSLRNHPILVHPSLPLDYFFLMDPATFFEAFASSRAETLRLLRRS